MFHAVEMRSKAQITMVPEKSGPDGFALRDLIMSSQNFHAATIADFSEMVALLAQKFARNH